MAAPNAIEVGLLIEFRQRFQNGELNNDQTRDGFLIRWIRARNHNLDKAEEFLRKNLKWRKDNDIDSILCWNPDPELKALIPITFLGFDEDGSPVYIGHVGRYKFLQIARKGQQQEALKLFDLLYEQINDKMKKQRQRDGTPVSQAVFVSDFKGFQFKCLSNKGVVDFLIAMMKGLEANFPETLKSLYCVNTGRLFPLLLAISKPILAPATYAKISFINSPSKWKPVLLEKIPAQILPSYYGGTNVTTELACDVEAENAVADDGELEFISVTLPQADKVTIALEAEETSSTINWAFKTNKKEINFVINSVVNGVEKIFVEETKVDSHLKLVEGSKACESTGEFVITFNNGGEAQELEYRVDIRSKSGAKQLSFD